MKAKIHIAYYTDVQEAKHAIHDLIDVGVQRDAISLVEGKLPTELLLNPKVTFPAKTRARYQAMLDRGGALVVAWVMFAWRKRAKSIFDKYPPQALENEPGDRFKRLFTRT